MPVDLVALSQKFTTLLGWAAKIADAVQRLEAVNTIAHLQQVFLASQADNDQLRTQNFELQKEIIALQNQIREHKDWNHTKQQYKLTQNTHGAFLFIHETNHSKVCPTCMGKKVESIMQPGAPGCWTCPICTLIVMWEPERFPVRR